MSERAATGRRLGGWLLPLLLLTMLLGPPGAVQATEPLRFYTEEYPPVSFSEQGKAAGMATELVQALAQRLGEPARIEVLPWARGYRLVQQQPGSALFVTIRNREREPRFKWVGPVLLATDGFYALRGSGLQLRKEADLQQFAEIAVPRDWFTYQELRARGLRNLLGVNEPAQMFKMLRLGRVKLIVADNLSFYARGAAAEQVAGLRPEDVEMVYPYRSSYGYLSFWPGTPDATIRRWQTALDTMRRDGSFSRIYQRWLPGATEPPLREPGL